MQKKLYFLNEEEKNRIINLHENATKKQYLLSEQEVSYGVGKSVNYKTFKKNVKLSFDNFCKKNSSTNVDTATLDILKNSTSNCTIFGMGYDTYTRLKGALEAISKDDLCATSKKYLRDIGASLIDQLMGCIREVTSQTDLLKVINTKFGGDSQGLNFLQAETTQQQTTPIPTTSEGDWKGYPCVPKNGGKPKTLKHKGVKNTTDFMERVGSNKKTYIYKNDGQYYIKGENVWKQYECGSDGKIYDKNVKETLVGWDKFPCVTTNPDAKKVPLKDGSVTYDLIGFYFYDNGRKMDKDTRLMSNYFCNPDGTIGEGVPQVVGGQANVEPKQQVTGVGVVTRNVQAQIPELMKMAGMEGQPINQDTINKLYDILSKK